MEVAIRTTYGSANDKNIVTDNSSVFSVLTTVMIHKKCNLSNIFDYKIWYFLTDIPLEYSAMILNSSF